ncbi:MAG: ATP-binding protein [Planctomycetota bacterium]
MRVVAATAIVGAGAGLVLIPIGILVDRVLHSVSSAIDAAADGEAAPPPGGRLAPHLSRALLGAAHRFREREQALKHQLRELEIRHRVSEVERKQTEEVLNSLRDGVIVTDTFNEVIMANEAAATVLGFELAGASYKPIKELVADERVVQLISDTREIGNFNDSRTAEYDLEVDGQKRCFEFTMSCVENHKHEVGAVVAIMHDETHEQEVSQMKSDFVSKASHELRTPLSSIRAYIEMLIDGEASGEESRQEFYGIIQEETDRLGRLIDNMLNLSRIEAGIVQIEREHVDMAALVEKAVDSIEPQAKEKQITLHSKTSPVHLAVEGDRDMLYQVVLNLMSNAVKYTPEGGRVTITVDSDNLTRSVLVSVSDSGLGIPPEATPHLFDKFYRVENYKRVAKGTGLGLSLCKHIVETVHNGQIGVESELGRGSKFWFSVPMEYAGGRAAA